MQERDLAMGSINVQRLRDVAMEDNDFMIELVDLFLDDMPEQLEGLRKAVEQADSDSTAKAAHRIKGAAGNVGAERLSQICGELEHASRAAEAPSQAVLAEIELEWARVRDDFGVLKDETTSASA